MVTELAAAFWSDFLDGEVLAAAFCGEAGLALATRIFGRKPSAFKTARVPDLGGKRLWSLLWEPSCSRQDS